MTHSIGRPGLRRQLTLGQDGLATTALELGANKIAVTGRELALELDVARWRHDIPIWRWHDGEDAEMVSSVLSDGFDDSGWRIVPHLHPVFTTTHDRPSWFRAWLPLPAWAEGESVSIVLGGLDHEDWTHYAVFLSGVGVGDWTGSGSLRAPHVMMLEAEDEAYHRIRFGGETLLVVRAEGLDRHEPMMRPGEDAHYFFQGWLLDQYVGVGGTTDLVDDFVPRAARVMHDGLEVETASRAHPTIQATLRYYDDGQCLRKSVVVQNTGPDAVRLLDVTLEEWVGELGPTGGGRGQPILFGNAFVGLEHPAGVQLSSEQLIRVVQMPGIDIAPRGSWESRAVVIGGGREDQDAAAAFRDYIRDLRARPTDRWVAYSALGWYDFTNPADPLPELTEELALHNLDRLRALAEQGIRADIYMFDDWWDEHTLEGFRRSAYPDGPGRVVEAIRSLGMRPGFWWATTRALWSAGAAGFLESARANDPEFGAPVALSGGKWAWIEEFGNLFIGERRYCMAAEPYRNHAREAISSHIAVLEAGVLKLDCAVLHCTSSAHDHRPGRHSVEPIVDAILDIVAACRERQPDLRVIWYWGFRSPWLLAHGDHLFDKGLLLEAATPASTPAPTTRQAMTLNVDQSIDHAKLIPMELQDTLGIWLGDVAWCNRIGTEEWQEAFLLDASRPSWLVQPWGDLDLLGTDDKHALTDILAWIRRIGHAGARTLRVGGDPWSAQPYGYARPMDGGSLVTITNPQWSEASIELSGELAGDRQAVELYPGPGRDPQGITADRDRVTIALRPFELRMIAFVPRSRIDGDLPSSRRDTVRPTRGIVLAEPPLIRGGESSAQRTQLPELGFGDMLIVEARLRRNGAWWYHPEPRTLLDIRASLDGLAVHGDVIPRTRDRNGPGSAWVLYRYPAGAAWSGRTLELYVTCAAPADVEIVLSAAAVDAWWHYRERRFRDPWAIEQQIPSRWDLGKAVASARTGE